MSLKIHTILTREEAYLGLKNSYSSDQTNARIRTRLKNVVLYNNINFTMIYLILSSSFSYYIWMSHTIATLNGVYFIIYLFIFIVSLFYSTLFLGNMLDLNLIEPLKSFPLTKKGILYSITLSWLFYSGLSVLFIAVPVTAVAFMIFHSVLMLIIEIIWVLLALTFGYSVGMLLSFLISAKSYRSKSRRTAIKQALKAFIVIFIIIFWQLMFYLSKYIFGVFSVFTSRYTGYWYIFPFSASYSVSNAISKPLISILVTAAYLVLFSILVIFTGSKFDKFIFEGFYLKESTKKIIVKHSKLSYRKPWLAYLIRTNHFLGRKPQALISFIIPFIFFVPLVINLIGSVTISYTYLMGSALIVVMMLSMASLSTMIIEGRSYWIINMLPLSKNRFALLKSISEFIIFTVILLVVFTFIGIVMKLFEVIYLALILNLLIAAFNTLYFTNSFLISKLKPDTYIVTAESFGGNIAGVVMILIAGILIYVPFGIIYTVKIICSLSTPIMFIMLGGSYVLELILIVSFEKIKTRT